jgi:hypothetical protein
MVFANDHSMPNRCLITLATKYNIETIYTQHASVTERFPALDFTYSFLDGEESYLKYKNIGNIRGKIFLAGSPRFDKYAQYASNNKDDKKIGVALSDNDSVEKAIELCHFILSLGGYKIIIRPHPAMTVDLKPLVDSMHGMEVSYPRNETSYEFISKVSLLIANESSIHLDACLLNVPSALFNFSEYSTNDWYSYIKNGLITVCNTYNDVEMAINQHRPVVDAHIVRYYNAAYQTAHFDNVGGLIATFIQCLLAGNEDKYISKYFTKKEVSSPFMYRI